MNKFIVLIVGVLLGSGGTILFNTGSHSYVRTDKDYFIEDFGKINKGTLLKVDEPMSEGFTRCILYLNVKADLPSDDTKDGKIVPYWLLSEEEKQKGVSDF